MQNIFINTPIARTIILAVRSALQSKNIIQSYPQKFAIAFSGGPDSTALAVACKRLNIPFILAHLDHGLRVESADEAQHVHSIAAILKTQAIVRRVNVRQFAAEHKIGIEEAGRMARFAFFNDIRTDYNCSWILLGHQADDLIEDILMRIIRGVGWPALGGMTACDPIRHIIRPLLEIPRADIEKFINECGIPCLHDSSNDKDDFLRNRLRHHVIPRLYEENPSLTATFKRIWKHARDDEDFWNEYLKPILTLVQHENNSLIIDECHIRKLPKSARMRFMATCLKMAKAQHIQSDTLYAFDDALMTQQRPKMFQFPGKTTVSLSHRKIIICNGST